MKAAVSGYVILGTLPTAEGGPSSGPAGNKSVRPRWRRMVRGRAGDDRSLQSGYCWQVVEAAFVFGSETKDLPSSQFWRLEIQGHVPVDSVPAIHTHSSSHLLFHLGRPEGIGCRSLCGAVGSQRLSAYMWNLNYGTGFSVRAGTKAPPGTPDAFGKQNWPGTVSFI